VYCHFCEFFHVFLSANIFRNQNKETAKKEDEGVLLELLQKSIFKRVQKDLAWTKTANLAL
jgi:hypothetical protein